MNLIMFTLFLKDTTHPSLRVKRIQGTKHRWEVSVTKNYRFNFEEVVEVSVWAPYVCMADCVIDKTPNTAIGGS